MINNNNIINLEDILDLSIESKEEYHSIYENKFLPRVTAIIAKIIEEPQFYFWSNSLGLQGKQYMEVMNDICNFGLRTHKGIELFIKGEQVPDETPWSSFNGFLKWWNIINENNNIIVLGQEQQMIGKYYGGTYDLLLKVNDKVILVDFKTSSSITYKYWIQMSAYKQLLKDTKNIDLDYIILLQLSKYEDTFQEYLLDLNEVNDKKYIDECYKTFQSMLYTYYHIINLYEYFNYRWEYDINAKEGRRPIEFLVRNV